MNRYALGAIALLVGCQVAPPPAPAPPSQSAGPGEKALYIHQLCEREAVAKCSSDTIYCNSYRQSYVKGCMIKDGVPPDYVLLLTQ